MVGLVNHSATVFVMGEMFILDYEFSKSGSGVVKGGRNFFTLAWHDCQYERVQDGIIFTVGKYVQAYHIRLMVRQMYIRDE